MTKIKREDILALKSLAAKLRDELIKEYQTATAAQWQNKLFSAEYEALEPQKRKACERMNTAQDIVENLLSVQCGLEYLGALE